MRAGFLGMNPRQHDFDRAEQVTYEHVYGFKELHIIRQQVKPQEHKWGRVFDDPVFQSPAWNNIENAAQFRKICSNRK